ncbi:glycosyltransferase [Carboxydocella sp. JDF658]|uniref:glycosyltransferase n=1 Tax=Carboxydocella sp. JDF658 TaxID=1926600 RepID=UPI0009AD74B3|nr:glycosyltransferase [Carboxydocella sp. JDF658]GAW31643.1 glycosyl transferase [Carboxydocella sp. JDF658]
MSCQDRYQVLVLVPAHNEEKKIAATVKSALTIPGVTRVVVVDDASTDRTAELAEAAGAEVIRLSRNLGKGGALNRGLKEFREDLLLLLDGDLGETAAEGVKLLTPLLEGRAEMTIARFPRASKKGGFGLVKGLARWGIQRLSGYLPQAPLSGQRGLTRKAMATAGGFAEGYGVEVALTVAVARAGLPILEVECAMTHDETGRDLAGFWHRGRQFYHVARTLCYLHRRYR